MRLHTITPCYLLIPLINVGPAAGMLATSVANVVDLMSKAIVLLMGKLTNVRVLIISKQCVVQRLQPRWPRAPKGATSGEECGNVSNPVLSGKEPDNEGMYNRFSCFAVHSKMSQNTSTKSKPMEGLYMDTDPDNRSEIITDVTIRVPGKPGTMMMEVKVDPGLQPSCIPLHKFQTLFPHLCRDGLPRPGLLDNTESEFQSYNGAGMTCYRYLLIDVKDKVTKKYHPLDST